MTETERHVSARWGRAFEANPGAREKFYVTVAYPYPSGAMHVGHGRTYIAPDVIARFYRMQGREVLYPMAFHVTGAPVIGISKRIARGDEKAVRLYRDLYKVPPDVLERFVDPLEIVRHFSSEYERVMRQCGLSIDWRRRFTTVDPTYSRFIEWQWQHLREGGHVAKGAHPVRYCPQCENPVGDHDLLEGDKAEIFKFTLVIFTIDGVRVPTATLRPETVYGVTNLWINPEVTYVRARIDGEHYYVSREAADKLSLQDHTVEILGEVPGSDLVDKEAFHPLCGKVPVLPARFVDPDMASGIVMSVPAHAPYDYVALRDLQAQGKYPGIQPVGLIEVKGYGSFPAKDAIEKADIKDQMDPRMDEVTQEVYAAEFANGRLLARYGGLPVREARDEVGILLTRDHASFPMFEFDTRFVVCRCGSRVFVKILHDQWFLKYSDPEWKSQVATQISRMELVPPEVRTEFVRTIDWLKDWACTRRIGLGTLLPWDKNWLIEPLSDSTIYMAYYTLAHRIRDMDPALLEPRVFDYIFLGKDSEGLPERKKLEEMRKEFLYWYPYDFRFSAKDLISNHLTFQIFHHVAIFPKNLLPKGMVVFGMGLLNGAKMSSSKGNVFLLEDALREFGADTVRMFLVGSAEPWQDFDWRNDLVASTRKQTERFAATVRECDRAGTQGAGCAIDTWMISRLQHRVQKATAALRSFQTRQALQEAFFGVESDLKWYKRRQNGQTSTGGALTEVASVWIRLMAPFIPFICETLWQERGSEGLVSFAGWPVPDKNALAPALELSEELLIRTVEDIESIMRLIQLKPEVINICVAPAWKKIVFSRIVRASDRNMALKELMSDEEMRARGKDAVDAAKQCTQLVHRLPPEVSRMQAEAPVDEMALFTEAKAFLEQEFGIEVRVLDSDSCQHQKSGLALPFKPAIIIE